MDARIEKPPPEAGKSHITVGDTERCADQDQSKNLSKQQSRQSSSDQILGGLGQE